MGDDDAQTTAEHLQLALEGAHAGEGGLVDDAEVAASHREELGVLVRGDRGDEVQTELVEQAQVGGRVHAGVEDDGELCGIADAGELARQLGDRRDELGDVGSVARIGMGGDRHRPVLGHDEREPDDAQVVTLVLRVAAPGDRVAVVRGVDVGGDVRHVEHEPLGGESRTRPPSSSRRGGGSPTASRRPVRPSRPRTGDDRAPMGAA